MKISELQKIGKSKKRNKYRDKFGRGMSQFYESKEWRDIRQSVIDRDGGTCQYCGDAGTQADHIRPRRRGGSDSIDNLVCSCARCNFLALNMRFWGFEHKKSWLNEQIKRESAQGINAPVRSAPDLRKRYKKIVGERDNKTCGYCGKSPCERVSAIVPVNRGGATDPSNFVLVCPKCSPLMNGAVFLSLEDKKQQVAKDRKFDQAKMEEFRASRR